MLAGEEASMNGTAIFAGRIFERGLLRRLKTAACHGARRPHILPSESAR